MNEGSDSFTLRAQLDNHTLQFNLHPIDQKILPGHRELQGMLGITILT